MKNNDKFEHLNQYIADKIRNNELSCAMVAVREKGTLIYKNKWGFSNVEKQEPVSDDSVFRVMSMTKPVTAVAIAQLFEQGKLHLDDKVSSILPCFAHPKVCCDPRYVYRPGMGQNDLISMLAAFQKDDVKCVDAKREITVRDLLCHCSGLEQGLVGLLLMQKNRFKRTSLEQAAEVYATYPLGFEPGTEASYSPLAGFDVLARILEVVSGQDAKTYFQEHLFDPLEMSHSTFARSKVNPEKLVRLYKRDNNGLVNVTNTQEDMVHFFDGVDGYVCGSGGLYSTLGDYENFANMLRQYGLFNGKRILKKETVELLSREGSLHHLETDPGMVWGLGVKIRQDPSKYRTNSTVGSYGWSGAYGTHFFVSPKDDLDVVFFANMQDANGSGFPVSKEVERLVYEAIKG